jgi:hypothetical protein
MITVLLSLSAILSLPQDTIEITEMSCPACTIVLDSLVRLGSTTDRRSEP